MIPIKKRFPDFYKISDEVASAIKSNMPVVALETTVVTHGLPYPQNIELSSDVEKIIRSEGAVPATIGVLHGNVHIGMSPDEVVELAEIPNLWKVSRRDFGLVIARGESGGTTVAGTLIAANSTGIRVFATGGIGGVHRDAPFDISADLPELSRTPMMVVCAGPKAILDIEATLEYLETAGVPVLGYQTDELPAFYYRESGFPVTARAESADEVVAVADLQWKMGLSSAVLVTVPPPESTALSRESAIWAIDTALDDAKKNKIRGKSVTPYLLARVSEVTGEESMRVNLALLHNNARVAAKIAVSYRGRKQTQLI